VTEIEARELGLEREIGLLLRWGVGVATAVAVVGGVLFLVRHGREPAHYSIFHGESPDLRVLGGVLAGVAAGKGRFLIQLGLLLLIATPVARVAVTMVAFARARDLPYVLITATVLGLLVVSLFAAPP